MRCHEAKQRLTQLASARSPLTIDHDLRQHLEACQDCAHQYRAALDLRASLDRASKSDDIDTIPLTVLKTRIEAQAESASKEAERMSVMARAINQMKRPRYSLPTAAVLVAALLAVLLPLRFGSSVEYEVAFAHVSPALAQNQASLRMLLDEFEIPDLDITVAPCEDDCEVVISSIKSLEELSRLIAIFEQEANATVLSANEIRFDDGERLYIKVGEDKLGNLRKVMTFVPGEIRETADVSVADLIEESRNYGNKYAGEALVILEKSDGEYRVKAYEPGTNSIWIKIVMPGGRMAHRFRNDDNSADTFLQGLDIDPSFLHDREASDSAPKEADEIQGEFLLNNHPNPFNPTTDIQFTLPHAAHVTLEVYNIKGQRIATLVDRTMDAGYHSVSFDGSKCASGVYLYRLTAGDIVESKKMMLVK